MKKYLLFVTTISLSVFLIACSGNSKKTGDTEQSSLSSKNTGGDETLLEYQFKIKMTDSLKPAGHLKLFISGDAVRSEMNMRLLGQEDHTLVMLASMDKPEQTILLNSQNKTYSKLDIKVPSDFKNKMEKMKRDSMVVVGEQELNGYNCTQVNIITTVDIPAAMAGIIGEKGGASSVTKYWMSKDIPGYKNMIDMLRSRPRMMNGIDAEVYKYGMPVKQVTMESGKVNFMMELIKAEQKNIPDEMFSVPNDYTDRKKSDN